MTPSLEERLVTVLERLAAWLETDASTPTNPVEADTAKPQALLIDIDAVALLINESARTVQRLCDRGDIPPPVRLGRSRRWRRAEIVEWIEAGCPSRRPRSTRRAS